MNDVINLVVFDKPSVLVLIANIKASVSAWEINLLVAKV
jgi:hypothetical protein